MFKSLELIFQLLMARPDINALSFGICLTTYHSLPLGGSLVTPWGLLLKDTWRIDVLIFGDVLGCKS